MEGEQRSQIRVAKGETHKSRHRGRVISICFDGQPIGTRRPIERRWSNRSDSYKSDLVGISFSRMPRISRSAAVRCTNRLRINIQHRQGCYTCTRAEATNRAKPDRFFLLVASAVLYARTTCTNCERAHTHFVYFLYLFVTNKMYDLIFIRFLQCYNVTNDWSCNIANGNIITFAVTNCVYSKYKMLDNYSKYSNMGGWKKVASFCCGKNRWSIIEL